MTITLIICYYYQKISHKGNRLIMNKVWENEYWIVSYASAVSSLIRSCVICIRLCGLSQAQKMAKLPKVRTESTPFSIKQGQWAQVKKYALLLIMHISWLIAIREPVKQIIYSHNGTNCIGVDTKLNKTLKTTKEPMKSYLDEQKCEFYFNTPTSSHMDEIEIYYPESF